MSNNKSFVVKNGLLAGRYLQSNGVETAGSEEYDIAGASYDSVSFSVVGQTTTAEGLVFNNDGTKIYIIGNSSDIIYQYSLSTAFDLSTVSYDNVSFSVNSQDTTAYNMAFNDDGTKMYVVGSSSDSVHQYTLSTAFDLSTASYDSISFSVIGQETTPRHVSFNPNGTKMYIIGNASDSVHQYTLSTAFDLSTASYDSISFSVSSQSVEPRSVSFNSDGTKMYMSGFSSADLFQYSLSTAFDVSTASYDSISFSVSSQDTLPRDVVFNTGGTKMYVIGFSTDTIYQYSTVAYTQTLDLSTGNTFSFTPSGATTVSFTNPPASGIAIGFAVEINGDGSAITWPSSVKWDLGTAPTATASKEVYTFITTDGGTSYVGKKAAGDIA